jgi:hypothetical protein
MNTNLIQAALNPKHDNCTPRQTVQAILALSLGQPDGQPKTTGERTELRSAMRLLCDRLAETSADWRTQLETLSDTLFVLAIAGNDTATVSIARVAINKALGIGGLL